MVIANVTGWSELMAGDLVGASFTMYDASFVGWTVAILFILFQLTLFVKTRNITGTWIAGVVFASIYIGGTYVIGTYITVASIQVISAILILELTGIIYGLVFK